MRLLSFIPLFPSTSILDRLRNLQGHPLTKLLLSQRDSQPEEKDEATPIDGNVILVGTYADRYPNFYTVIS